jgi:hypothetical protein
LTRETEGQQQAEKTVDGGGQRHDDAIRRGKTVGGDGGTEGTREKDTGMREEEKRRPEDPGADREMVFEVASGLAKEGSGLVVFVEARAAEAFVGMAVIFGEIEIMLDKRSASEGIVADTIAAHPRIEKRNREKKKKKEKPLRFARRPRGRCTEVLLVHERGTRRKSFRTPVCHCYRTAK